MIAYFILILHNIYLTAIITSQMEDKDISFKKYNQLMKYGALF